MTKKIDAYQMSQEDFRNRWVNQMTEIRLSQLEKSPASSNDQLQALLRLENENRALVVKSLVLHGLARLISEQRCNPSCLTRFQLVTRMIRFHPYFRALTMMMLPTQTFIINEKQIEFILLHGESAFQNGERFRDVREIFSRNRKIGRWNDRVAHILMTATTLLTILNTYPDLRRSIDDSLQIARQTATADFEEKIKGYARSSNRNKVLTSIVIEKFMLLMKHSK